MSSDSSHWFFRTPMGPMKFWILFCYMTILYASPTSKSPLLSSEIILSRHARAMIDMRGFPDPGDLCPNGAIFYRNKTDCVQFYRCVDFNRNGKHTVFRFMCGPMAVFDPSRSLCTGPHMAVPPCPKDQLPPMNMTAPPTVPPTVPPSIPPTKPPTVPSSVPPTIAPSIPPTEPPTVPPSVPPTVTPSVPPTVPSSVPPTIASSVPPTEPPTVPPTVPPTEPPTVPSSVPPTIASSVPPSVPPTDPPTVPPTVPVSVPPTITPSVPPSVPPTEPPTVPPTELPPNPESLDEISKGTLIVEDRDKKQGAQIENLLLPSKSISGVVSPGNDYNVTITSEDGTTNTINVPSGAMLLITTTEDGGQVTSLTSGVFTTNSTTALFPPKTTYEIIKVGVNGQIIKQETVVTTTTKSEVQLGWNVFYGQMNIVDNRVTSIGEWSFNTQYIGESVLHATVSKVKTLQTTITSFSTQTYVENAYISGIVTVGQQSLNPTTSTTNTLVVSEQDLLAIIPDQGRGNITIVDQNTKKETVISITPGTFVGVTPSPGVNGTVTNLDRNTFVSSSSIISFPSGTVTTYKIGIDGKLVKVSTETFTTDFTLTSALQSIVGVVKTTNDIIQQIGEGHFSVEKVTTSPSSTLYLGVLNFNMLSEVQMLSGILQIGNKDFLDRTKSSSTKGETIAILPGTTSALIVSGEIKITEEDGASVKQTAVSISSGGILGIVTLSSGGTITGIVDGYFTTQSTQVIFPSGTKFGIVIIRPDGTMNLHNAVETTIKTTMTVPVGSIYGLLNITSQGVITRVGSASFTTQYLLISDSTTPNLPATLGNYGIIHFGNQFHLNTSAVYASKQESNQLNTISAIIQLTPRDQYKLVNLLVVRTGSKFVIIPKDGHGTVSVNYGNSVSNFTVLPGQLFGFSDVRDAKVTDIGDSLFTTVSTTMTFGAGTNYGIMKIGLDGSVFLSEPMTAQNTISITVTTGSTVGTLESIIVNGQEMISAIGRAPFLIKDLTDSSTGTKTNNIVGLLGIDERATFIPPRPIQEPFTFNCTSERPFQYPLDCSRFYQCVMEEGRRTIYVFPCAPGLYFDDYTSQCRTPEEAFCDDPTTVNDTSTSGDLGGIIQLDCDGNFRRYPINCANFYTCFKNDDDQDVILTFACAEGLVFDEPSVKCLTPEETLSCGANEKLYNSPSVVFKLGEEIDVSSLISSAKDIFSKKKTTLTKTGRSESTILKLPHQAGRGASHSKMEILMSKKIEN